MKYETENTLLCNEKLSFDTKEAAEGAAIYAKHRHGTQQKTYKCKHCSLWHLTSV
jgi:hypothetical protein